MLAASKDKNRTAETTYRVKSHRNRYYQRSTAMEYSGIVYVVTNPSMPNMVKIGKTSVQDVNSRMRQLYTTSVPTPFECACAKAVEDARQLESALHTAFAPSRVNQNREYFMIDTEQAVALLKTFPGRDVTPDVSDSLDSGVSESERASARRISRRPQMDFNVMSIPVGSTLSFQDGSTDVETVNGKKVKYDGQEMSLTAVTRVLLDIDYNVQPASYWYYNGELLKNIYDRTYVDDE